MATETNNVNSSPTPEAEHLRSLLLGSWLVKAILAHDANDPSATPIPVFSKHPNGGLLYAQDGYMSAVMQSTQAPDFKSWHSPTVHESHNTISDTQCYMGRFYIDSASMSTLQQPAQSPSTTPAAATITNSQPTDFQPDASRQSSEKTYKAIIYHEPFASLPPNWRHLGKQKRNATVTTGVTEEGKEVGRTLVMKVETAVELGMWLPKELREEEEEGGGAREGGRDGEEEGEREEDGVRDEESGVRDEESGVRQGRKWRLEVRFERALGNEGILQKEGQEV